MIVKPVALMIAMALGGGAGAEAQVRGPAPAAAARPALTDKVFVSVNGVFQVGANDFSDSQTIRENAENGRFDTAYTVGAGPAFDVSASAVVWRSLAVGAGVSRFSKSTATAVNASVPHPFFFNQPRSVTGEFSGTRQELAVHVQVRGVFPVSNRVHVTVFGGPSFFTVEQSIVDDFEYTEAYPYDAATFNRAVASTQSESKVGVNVGGDVSVFFNRQVGVGVSFQYAGATVQMAVPSGTADVKAGGGQIGGGLRLRF
jgi:hypothetical protein